MYAVSPPLPSANRLLSVSLPLLGVAPWAVSVAVTVKSPPKEPGLPAAYLNRSEKFGPSSESNRIVQLKRTRPSFSSRDRAAGSGEISISQPS